VTCTTASRIELVALIFKLSLAEQEPDTSPSLAVILVDLGARAQNVAKHAGRHAQVTLRLHHDHGTLTVGIEDDGRGFDPAHTPEGAGFRNIHDRIGTLGGTVQPPPAPATAPS
jgi:glucose-6-phosphate-specific signal transduction histidine kinase